MKLKGRRFETGLTSNGNRKRYTTALRKMTSTVFLKRGKNGGIAVYVHKETILKEMTAKIKLRQHFFFDVVRELSDTTSHIYPINLEEHIS
jgi:hypothetical protein